MCRLVRYYNCLGNFTIPIRASTRMFKNIEQDNRYSIVFVYKDENYQEVDSFYVEYEDYPLSHDEFIELTHLKKE